MNDHPSRCQGSLKFIPVLEQFSDQYDHHCNYGKTKYESQQVNKIWHSIIMKNRYKLMKLQASKYKHMSRPLVKPNCSFVPNAPSLPPRMRPPSSVISLKHGRCLAIACNDLRYRIILKRSS